MHNMKQQSERESVLGQPATGRQNAQLKQEAQRVDEQEEAGRQVGSAGSTLNILAAVGNQLPVGYQRGTAGYWRVGGVGGGICCRFHPIFFKYS